MKTYQNSLNNVLNAFSENHQHSKDELKQLLKEQGVDTEKLIIDSLEKIKKIQTKAKIAIAKQKMMDKMEFAKQKIKPLIPSLSVDNKIRLAQILWGNQVAVNFNKLENLNDDDITDMLDESALLEFLDELENNIEK